MKIISGGKITLLLFPLLLCSCGPSVRNKQGVVSDRYSVFFHEMPNDSVRYPGSPQEAAAADIIADAMQQNGLQKFIDSTSYFHEFNISSGMRQIDGKNYIRFMQQKYMFEDGMVLPLPSSPNANIEAPICWTGYGIRDQNYNDLEGIDLHGKLALILDGNPDFIRHPLSLNEKVKILAGAGAVGVIVAPKSDDPSFPGRDVYARPVSLLPIPVMKVTRKTAGNLVSVAGYKLGQIQSKITSRQAPDSFSSGLRVTIYIRQTPQRRICRNIVGYLSGKGHSGNYIVVMAPYDFTQNDSTVTAEDAGLLKLMYDSISRSRTYNLLFLSASGRNGGLSGLQAFLNEVNQAPFTIHSFILLHHIADADSLQLTLVAGDNLREHIALELRSDSANKYLRLSKNLPLSAGPVDSLLYAEQIPYISFYGEKKSTLTKTKHKSVQERLAHIERGIQLLGVK